MLYYFKLKSFNQQDLSAKILQNRTLILINNKKLIFELIIYIKKFKKI
jgi:hypothetical protein